MNTVYLIIFGSGQHEDYSERIIGWTRTPEQAEAQVQKYTDIVKFITKKFHERDNDKFSPYETAEERGITKPEFSDQLIPIPKMVDVQGNGLGHQDITQEMRDERNRIRESNQKIMNDYHEKDREYLSKVDAIQKEWDDNFSKDFTPEQKKWFDDYKDCYYDLGIGEVWSEKSTELQ